MPSVRPNNQPVPSNATRKRKRPDNKSDLMLHLLGKIAENTARAALGQRELLTLAETAWCLGTCDATLRKKGVLNDLGECAHVPEKLNGIRLTRAENAQWRFQQKEVRRFGPKFHGANFDPGDDDIEIRGT